VRIFLATALWTLTRLLPMPLEAQATLTVIVTDSNDARIPFTSIAHASGNSVTDREGVLRLTRLKRGDQSLLVRRIGYLSVRLEVEIEGDTTINVVLAPVPSQLSTVVVSARRLNALERTGFYDRMLDRQKGLNSGVFITPEAIEQRNAGKATQLLHEVPGVRLSNVERVGMIPQGANGCAMTIYVDGVRVITYGTDTREGTSMMYGNRTGMREDRKPTGISVDDLVPPSQLAAIEVYARGTRAPPQFQPLSGSCGIVALWTKS
jgi:hypothetical protein